MRKHTHFFAEGRRCSLVWQSPGRQATRRAALEAAVAVKGALVGAATRPAQAQLLLAVNDITFLRAPAGQRARR